MAKTKKHSTAITQFIVSKNMLMSSSKYEQAIRIALQEI